MQAAGQRISQEPQEMQDEASIRNLKGAIQFSAPRRLPTGQRTEQNHRLFDAADKTRIAAITAAIGSAVDIPNPWASALETS
jgi:hypothetical protein